MNCDARSSFFASSTPLERPGSSRLARGVAHGDLRANDQFRPNLCFDYNEAFARPSPFCAIRPVWDAPRLGRHATEHRNRSSRSQVRGGHLQSYPRRARAYEASRRASYASYGAGSSRGRAEVAAAYWRATRSISVLSGMSAQPWLVPNRPDGRERRWSRERLVKGAFRGL